MNKVKFITLNAVLVLGLLPIGTTLASVETVHAEEISQRAGVGSLLDDKLKQTSSIGVDVLAQHADALAAIVNQQANEGILTNYSAEPERKAAMESLYKTILISEDGTFTLHSLTNQISSAQLIINGKTSITANEIKEAQSLTIEFKLFEFNLPDPSTSQMVTVNVNPYSVKSTTINTKIESSYQAETGISVKTPAGIPVESDDIEVKHSGGPVNANGIPLDLIEAGIADATGNFINVGSYNEELEVKVAGTVVASNLKRTIIVGIGEFQPSFRGEAGQGTRYDHGSTVTNAIDFLAIEGDQVTAEQLEQKIKSDVITNFHISDKNAIASTSYQELTNPAALSVDTSSINLFKSGTYQIPVTYSKPGSKIVSTITVPTKVTAVSPPVIRFSEGQNLTIKAGESFDMTKNLNVFENQAAAANPTNSGKNVTWSIEGNIDTNKEGVYTLRYIATNIKGAKTELTRIITVEKSSEAPKIENYTTVGYVNYVPGYGIRVWEAPNQTATDYFLPHASAWKIDQKATFKDGSIWYRVGKNQWVDGKYISLSPVTSGEEVSVDGIATINYVAGYSVNVYSSPLSSEASWTGKQLKHGTKWRTFKKTTLNGTTFYNLGGNQWVDSQYIIFSEN